jgi:phosphopantothenoylcysteine decarboxylase / phosphopantothenate---cysteine ligase
MPRRDSSVTFSRRFRHGAWHRRSDLSSPAKSLLLRVPHQTRVTAPSRCLAPDGARADVSWCGAYGHNPSVARILLGVTGGIAAYKACELTRLLVKRGHEVIPLVTAGAERFVRAETFHALARRPPQVDLYEHLTRADLLVVAPCTANTLAKLANGLADNVLTEAALAHRGPILVAPAMNPRMWAHPATRANVETLTARGVELVGPDEGEVAEGEWGVGRMAEPEEIAARVEQLLAPGSLSGKRVLVTAGGTREPVDSVRFVGNRASGRMGVALAEEARRRGAEVVLLAANLAVPAPHGLEVVPTPTAETMLDAALALPDVDLLLLAAAVADYRPAEALATKRPKSDETWIIGLAPTRDIARALGERKRDGQVLVAFGAEHGEEGLERKRRMLETKNADLVVYNDVSRADIGFDADENEVVLVTRETEQRIPKASKRAIAAAILDEAERLLP